MRLQPHDFCQGRTDLPMQADEATAPFQADWISHMSAHRLSHHVCEGAQSHPPTSPLQPPNLGPAYRHHHARTHAPPYRTHASHNSETSRSSAVMHLTPEKEESGSKPINSNTRLSYAMGSLLPRKSERTL